MHLVQLPRLRGLADKSLRTSGFTVICQRLISIIIEILLCKTVISELLFDELAKSPESGFIISITMKGMVWIQALVCATHGGVTSRTLDNRG